MARAVGETGVVGVRRCDEETGVMPDPTVPAELLGVVGAEAIFLDEAVDVEPVGCQHRICGKGNERENERTYVSITGSPSTTTIFGAL